MRRLFIFFILIFIAEISMAQKINTVSNDIQDSDTRNFYESAIKVADWLINNQEKNGYNANHGRFAAGISIKENKIVFWAPNWMNGASIMGLLMTYHRTSEKKYLEAAIRGGEYLKSLQILDARNKEFYGAFREDTPQSSWCHPRDGLTASWALLWLYDETKENEYLERVKLFNSWFLEYAMRKGWPAWSYYFYDKKPDYLQGSFHGGDGAYFYDYYFVTRDRTYIESGFRFIVDYAIEKFLGPDGKVRVIFDSDTGKYIEDGTTFDGMQKMHRHNDDFMSISILDAYIYYKDRKYLDRAEAYAKWLISEQREDGGFGKPDVPPAAATGPNFLIDLYRVTGKKEYLNAAVKAGKYLITRQVNNQENKLLHGGFYGYDGNWNSEHNDFINIRTSAYALIALLKLEGKEKGPFYSAIER